MVHVAGQGFDLGLDGFVFVQLAFEEVDGDAALFFDAPGGEHVGVGPFGFGLLEAFDLDEAPFGQLRDAVVHLAHTDPHFFGHVPLAQPGFLGQEVEQAVVDLLVVIVVHGLNLLEDGMGVVKGIFCVY